MASNRKDTTENLRFIIDLDDLVKRDFKIEETNKKLFTDISYAITIERQSYLSITINSFSNEILNWELWRYNGNTLRKY